MAYITVTITGHVDVIIDADPDEPYEVLEALALHALAEQPGFAFVADRRCTYDMEVSE